MIEFQCAQEFKKKAIQSLYEVKKLIEAGEGIKAVIKLYSNFYYFESLDGHEKVEEVLWLQENCPEIVELHRVLQIEILNGVYSTVTEKMPEGRISEYDAIKSLRSLLKGIELLK